MHRVFRNEGGFGDRELRTIQSSLKRRARREPSVPEAAKSSTQKNPSARAKHKEAA
ncbi:MAG: hypothetical protein ACE5IQ_00125 [Candidatus Methylomirabilales bacterium]